ncbi:TetR/AcrR family transcriptional regulator [Deinococcus humi]|uniref:AcrR family transcriptional regulator n=1 Tax=Deinococcus humi TaxID=662880 RepID=A0A7W8NEP9_9DEIO|nr:TetR/AcrR family transcriptional regulator [Deinococcus humi]MBB5364589.1 AcrR family transcriptional regulator [Deinococcus humi]GGO41299.1 TetR family transcriptional regulator [Deinococcus humi]
MTSVMPDDTPVPKRRRGAVLEQAILRAAAAELLTAGYANFNMDQVARRAGTNKNALYRRWPGRAALAFAAYRHLAAEQFTPPDTGNLRENILTIMRSANQHWASPLGEVLRGLLAGLPEDPEVLKQLQARGAEGGAELFMAVLERAVAQGEARPEALRPRVAGVALALLRHEYLMRGVAEVPDDVLMEIVDEVYLPLVRRQ